MKYLILCLLLTSCAGHEFGLIESNDFFNIHGNKDLHFTQGLELQNSFPVSDTKRLEFDIGQNIYTPGSKQQTTVVQNDRPYAGFLYVTGKTIDNFSPTEQNLYGLQLGLIGPSARGEQVQNGFHALIGDRTAKGWANQLHDEPTLNMELTRRTLVALYDCSGTEVKTFTYYGTDLGTALTQQRSSARISAQTHYLQNWMTTLYFLAETRVVERNILLDGNTFKESHSVDREPLVARIQAGIRINYRKFFIQYFWDGETQEFKQQKGFDTFGQIIFGYGWFN